MGGAIEIRTIRPGVQFTPDAANAFERAEAQVIDEFGRNIDVNSTYRDRETQLSMHNAYVAYLNGTGPRPAHSWAVHPDESFHVSGEALDTDDWRIPRIVDILAENGFIRNRLYVSGEEHHFEYIRSLDRNYGKPINRMEKVLNGKVINVVSKYGEPDSNGTLWIAHPDGTFKKYNAPFDPNVRGVISKWLYGGNGTQDNIPTFNQRDFETISKFWKVMCGK